jgi:hypothetical protein
LLYLNVLTVLSLVFGDLIRIFGYPPTAGILPRQVKERDHPANRMATVILELEK